MREKGIDGRHAEADSLGLGNQPGTTPFVNAVGYLQVTSGLTFIRSEEFVSEESPHANTSPVGQRSEEKQRYNSCGSPGRRVFPHE
jgi:hypothetical protein